MSHMKQSINQYYLLAIAYVNGIVLPNISCRKSRC